MTELATGKLAVNGGTPVRTRPFPRWPHHDDAERDGLLRVLDRGAWGGRVVRGQGEAAAFEAEFAALHEAPAALAVTSGTHALQLALDLVGTKPGDEVLIPALTPIPIANAVRQRGAVPVLVDVDPDTYCLDPDRLDAARTDRCAAVIAVHLGGHIADMERIIPWAARSGVAVIQDAAHAHGARWRERGIGAFGTIATFSFMQTKVMTAGEGGAVLLPEQNRHRELRWRQLVELLAHVPGVTPQGRDPRCTTHPHYLPVLTLDPDSAGAVSRDRVVAALQAEGIPFYPMGPPVYRFPAFWDAPAHPSAPSAEHLAAVCANTEHIGGRGFWLRHKVLLGDERDIQDVAEAVEKVVGALTAEAASA